MWAMVKKRPAECADLKNLRGCHVEHGNLTWLTLVSPDRLGMEVTCFQDSID